VQGYDECDRIVWFHASDNGRLFPGGRQGFTKVLFVSAAYSIGAQWEMTPGDFGFHGAFVRRYINAGVGI
jgi:hypothetical protein